jgi:diguanylate cyclase (GGDEF)-like protein/PAS domain S-box-containing protein
MMDAARPISLDVLVRRGGRTGGGVDVSDATSDDAAARVGRAPSGVLPRRAHNDDTRLRVLGEFGILDSPNEQDFDDLTALAARLCATPAALVSLLDADRVWFKSRWGTTGTHVPRDTSFCDSILESRAMLVVPDASQDPRFSDGPLVAAACGVRFYAGAPLIMSDGDCVGALCVFDTVPRTFDEQQRLDLTMLARQVVSQLELRRTSHRLRAKVADTKLAEAELRRSRQLLDEVLGHTDVVVYAKDLDGHFLMANPAMERSVGVGSGEVVGRTAAELFGQDTAAEFDANDAVMLESGSWQVFVEHLLQPDGTIRLFRSTKFPLTDAAGDVYAVAGVATDVTELTSLRTEMLESERRFRMLFDYSPVSLALSDEQGNWTEVNAACGRLVGADPADLIGRSALDFTHPDDREQRTRAELAQAEPGSVGEAEVRIGVPGGPTRWAWLSLTPIPGPDGRTWTLGVAQDITTRKTMEDDLRRSEEELAAVAAVARCVQSGADPRPVIVDRVLSLSGAAGVRLLEPTDRVLVETAQSVIRDTAVPGGASDTAESVHGTGRRMFRTNAGPGGCATLWEPVVVEEEVIAVLEVSWTRTVTDVSDPAVAAVQILAGEAGASLHAVQLRRELERSATTDPLTGALNRRAWNTQLGRLAEQVELDGTSLVIALVDFDNFKVYNDTHGHAAGDDLLCEFAAEVRQLVGSAGLFARWGGEEFILALVDAEPAHIDRTLDRIAGAVPGAQTCSIGHTRWRSGEPRATCIARADTALYAAKAAGRNRVVGG